MEMCGGQGGSGQKTGLEFSLQNEKNVAAGQNWGCNEYGDSEAQGCQVGV
jgi:hypothetical protein